MKQHAWPDGIDVAITVCDRAGTILYMNGKSAATFAAQGGGTLVGRSLMPCHPEAARDRIGRIMETRQANTYTIEKNGVRKLIHQAPWYEKGELGGLVEFSIVLPADMPHYKRS
jgi:transcriptional regulator with PAS, ATPase and Fis domain